MEARPVRVLVIESDPLLLEQITSHLARSGYVTDGVHNAVDGWHLGNTEDYDAIVLDRVAPHAPKGFDGLSVLRNWRTAERTMPVVLLSSLGDCRDKIDCLRAGADDHLLKPFDFSELVARLEALIRRTTANGVTVISIGDVSFDLSSRQITKDDVPVELTSLEYRAFSFLARNKGRLVSKSELSERIYDMNFDCDSNVIEAVISRLRRKLGRELIQTSRGRGYCLCEPSGSNAGDKTAA